MNSFSQRNTEILNSFSEDSLLALQCISLCQKSMAKPLSQGFFALLDSHIQSPTKMYASLFIHLDCHTDLVVTQK